MPSTAKAPTRPGVGRAEHMGALRTLELYGCEISDDGACALAQAPHLTHIEASNLGSNFIGSDGASALALSPYLPRWICEVWEGENAWLRYYADIE